VAILACDDGPVPFPSDEWLTALAEAAARVTEPALAGVQLTIEQAIEGEGSWQLVITGGRVAVRRAGDADVRFTTTPEVAAAIRSGQRSALDAFLAGELRIGGDTQKLLAHHKALAAVGDLLAIPG
jgi:putative sterol carrier protein